MTEYPTAPPAENLQRGTLFALVVVPLGVIAWVLLWSFGFIASIVAFGVAAGAVYLYRFGSGGAITRTGAIRVIAITIATLLLAIFAGVVSDGLRGYTEAVGGSWIEAITSSQFWDLFGRFMADGDTLNSLIPSLLISLAFGALGCFRVPSGPRSEAPQEPFPSVSPDRRGIVMLGLPKLSL